MSARWFWIVSLERIPLSNERLWGLAAYRKNKLRYACAGILGVWATHLSWQNKKKAGQHGCWAPCCEATLTVYSGDQALERPRKKYSLTLSTIPYRTRGGRKWWERQGFEVPVLITIRGKKIFNLVVLMLGRVKSFDILNPCLSHHLRPPPSTARRILRFVGIIQVGRIYNRISKA